MRCSNRLSLSIAGTAAVAFAALPLGVSPANAAKVTEWTTSSTRVLETSGNVSQFKWSVNNGQSLAQRVVPKAAEGEGRGRGGRGNATRQIGGWLNQLFEFLGIQSTSGDRPTESVSISNL